MRTAVLAALAFLAAGCATAPVVDAPTVLNGHELDTALSLYGPWDQKIFLNGQPNYVWRRAVVLHGQSYYCELRAEPGFRNIVRSTVVEGYPAACGLFVVQYTAGYDQSRTPPTVTRVARNWRPVGSGEVSASASASGRDAAARPRSADADRGGSE